MGPAPAAGFPGLQPGRLQICTGGRGEIPCPDWAPCHIGNGTRRAAGVASRQPSDGAPVGAALSPAWPWTWEAVAAGDMPKLPDRSAILFMAA